MSTLEIQGRLGNNIIQLMSVFLFCEKHNLNLFFEDRLYNHQSENVTYHYSFNSLLNQEMVNLVKKNNTLNCENKIIVNDDNFVEFYYKNKINCDVFFKGYFYVFDILKKEREKIKKLFNVSYEYVDENDLFIHYRLGDINNSNLALPLEYYIESIDGFKYNKGFISSESLNDSKCQYLIQKYNLTPVKLTPYETIMFGKNFKNIILSESTFSFLIGYFSNAKNIIYNKKDSKWGDNFLFNFGSFKFN